jgi:hypothetical protein
MTGSASHKYTDRDVRENELEMRHFVESYLERYHGEFEFLIDCKMRVAEGYTLSTGMVRGVLNCMRNDPRVKGLPAPAAAARGRRRRDRIARSTRVPRQTAGGVLGS